MRVNRLSLRLKIYSILTLLVLITLTGGAVMVWYTYQMENLLSVIIDQDIAAFRVAEELESALINQKGFVSYYFLDGNPDWLRQLGQYRQVFKERLKTALQISKTDAERKIIDRIRLTYESYVDDKDRVISYYREGHRVAAADLHNKVRHRFFEILDSCEAFKRIHTDQIRYSRQSSHRQARHLRYTAIFALVTAFGLAVSLAVVLVFQILGPIRRLSLETDREGRTPPSVDEITTLRQRVEGLLEDVDQTHSELERSRETLLQAEKMAMVGKLAAGMAHSIRNPFTSVKMRLFSLSRTLKLTASQRDDFDVISEEIRHIDQIVENFLEFSRPPKLKMQEICPSTVIDNALQLLEHRLEAYNVEVTVNRQKPLPDVTADPEQLKEVVVNIIINACEAMERGGSIFIDEGVVSAGIGTAAQIRIRDSGPGIPDSVRGKIFQPFFTTKDQGTGLGLSIANRIIAEHRGLLHVDVIEGQGTEFVIQLPIEEVAA
jgi:signal transduction histidine kinase